MSVCAPAAADEESAPVEEPAVAVREMYEQKAVSKVVRVLTVLAYLFSVSLAAILLSIYYVCVWKSPEVPMAIGSDDPGALRADAPHTERHIGESPNINETHGGSNSTVNIKEITPQTTTDVMNTAENNTSMPIINYTESLPSAENNSQPPYENTSWPSTSAGTVQPAAASSTT